VYLKRFRTVAKHRLLKLLPLGRTSLWTTLRPYGKRLRACAWDNAGYVPKEHVPFGRFVLSGVLLLGVVREHELVPLEALRCRSNLLNDKVATIKERIRNDRS
jgi:hypothetical protein